MLQSYNYNYSTLPLKSIGKISNYAKELSILNRKDNTVSLTNMVAAINSLDDIGDASSLLKYTGATKEFATEALKASSFAEDIFDMESLVNDIVSNGGKSSVVLSGLGDTITNLGSKIAPVLPALAGIGGILAAIKVFQWADDKFTLTYGTATKKLEEASSSLSQTRQEVSSLDSQLQSIQTRISELQSQPKLSFTDQKELQSLQQKEKSLQNEIAFKKELSQAQMVQTATAAQKKVQWANEKSDTLEYNSIGGGHGDIVTPSYTPKLITKPEKLEEEISKYNEIKEKISSLNKKEDSPQKTKQLESYNAQLKETTDSLSKLFSTYQADALNFYDPNTGKAIKGFEEEASEYERIQALASTLGKSSDERDPALLDSFFNGSSIQGSGMKDYFLDLAKSKQLTEDSFQKIGITAESLGIDNLSTAVKYFNDLANAADNAAEATSQVNNHFSVDDIATAFSSKNAGDDYVSLNGYMKKAKDLFDQGLVGTDEFKAVAEAISYGVDSSAESFQANYDKLQRYFTTDDSGNLTRGGVDNFLADLSSKGNDWAVWDDSSQKWNLDIDNTAEAAKQLEVSVEFFESMLGRIKDYDLAGSFDITSSLQQFSEAQKSLDGLHSIYNNMADGDAKDRLGDKLSRWDSNIANAQEDLSTLPEELVTTLKFEYEKADLELANEKAEESLAAGQTGETRATTQAGIISNKRQIYEDTLEQKGLSEDKIDEASALGEVLADIAATEEEISEAAKTQDFEALDKAQEKLKGLYDDAIALAENPDALPDPNKTQEEIESIKNSFSSMHPEITPETNTEEANAAFNDWASSVDGKSILATLDINDTNAINAIAEITGVEPSVIINYIKGLQENPDSANAAVNYEKGSQPQTVDNAIGKADFTMGSQPEKAKSINGDANYTGIFPLSAPALTGIAYYSASISKISSAATAANKAISNAIGGHSVNGTANLSGTAYANGYWGNPVSGRKLVGELGPEIVVNPYTSRWYTVGNNGPEFANVPKNAIVFNHLQSASLLKNGYALGRAGALAAGTAFASGTAYASGSNSKLDSLTDYFDWIKIRMDRISDATKRAIDSIDTAVGLASKQSKNTAALSQIQKEISENQSAYNRYLSHANWFASQSGLSASYQTQIQNGTLDISKLDDDTKKKVDEYKKWYDLSQDCLDTVNQLQEKEAKLAKDRLDYIEKYYDKLIDVSDSVKDLNEAKLDFNKELGYSQLSDEVKDIIRDSMNEESKTYNHLVEQLAQYQAEFNSLMSQGYIKKDDDSYYEALKQISEFNEAIIKSSIELDKLGDQLREIDYTKLEYTIDQLSRDLKRLGNIASLEEKRGNPVSEDLYQSQITKNNASIQANYELRQKKLEEQSVYDMDTKNYQDLAKEISSLDSEIFDLMEDNEDLKESIWELRFTEPLEELMDGYDRTMKTADSLRKLMDDDTFLDESGALTENGLANLALLMQSYNTAKQKVSDYQEAVRKLDDAYANGILSQSQYEESLNDLLKDIQNSVGDVEDYKNDILDLYKDQIKAEVDYMQEYIDKRQEMRKKEEDYYEFSEKMRSKSKDVNQLKAQIAALQGTNNLSAQAELKRLNQELAERQSDLDEARRDHRNDMIDQGYDTLSDKLDDALDNTLSEIATNAQKQEQVISDMLGRVYANYESTYSKINQLIHNTGFMGDSGFNQNLADLGTQQGAQSQVQTGSTSQSNTSSSGTMTGVDTGAINQNNNNSQILDEISKMPNTTDRPVAELTLSTNAVSLLEGKTANVSARIRPTDAANKTLKWTSSNPQTATAGNGTIRAVKAGTATITCTTTDGSGLSASVSVTVTAPPPPAPPAPKPDTSNQPAYGGIPFVYKYDSYPKNRLNTNTSIVDRLKSHNFDSSFGARNTLYRYWFGGGYMGSGSQNTALINKMRSAGYRRGTRSVPKNGSDWVHEGEIIIRPSDGGILFPLQHRDGVIPSGLSDNLWKLAENAPRILSGSLLDISGFLTVMPAQAQTVNTQFHFDTLLNIEGSADSNTVQELKDALPSLGKELTQIVSKELHRDWKKLR